MSNRPNPSRAFSPLLVAVAVLSACVLAACSSPTSTPGTPTPGSSTRGPTTTPPPPPSPTPATALFTGLHNGSMVSYKPRVTGHLASIPSGMDTWLVIVPTDAPTYWPQPGPLQADVKGNFDAPVTFGYSTDKGKSFILMIVDVPPDGSHKFLVFTSTTQYTGLPGLPSGSQILAQINVTRS